MGSVREHRTHENGSLMGLGRQRAGTRGGSRTLVFFFFFVSSYTSPGQFFQPGLRFFSLFPPRCFRIYIRRIPFYRRPRRRFILIPFCNASPGTGRKSFPGQKLKGLKARRNDSTLSYVHYHFPFCLSPTFPIVCSFPYRPGTHKNTIPFYKRIRLSLHRKR